MMLTTPEMASEPYSDEAPSCRMSMRSMMLAGMVFKSTEPDMPVPEVSLTQRKPSTRTRMRPEPRLRRSIAAEPAPAPLPSAFDPKLPGELNLVLSAAPAEVTCCRMSPTLVRPVFCRVSEVMVSTGTWVAMSAPLMRVPVTCTACRLMVWDACACVSAPAGGASWANSAELCMAAPAANARESESASLPRRKIVVMYGSPST